MADLQDIGRYTADGYSFYTRKDAVLAESELQKVKYLEEKLDYSKPQNVLRIYNKMIDDHMFKSPVGHHFLRNLQQYLIDSPGIKSEQVKAIPMHVTYDGEFRDRTNPARERVKPAEVKQRKSAALPISIILNIALAAAVIAMFAITLQSDQPNILNYEKAITNRYASWEQDLTERERVIREKERDLNIGQ